MKQQTADEFFAMPQPPAQSGLQDLMDIFSQPSMATAQVNVKPNINDVFSTSNQPLAPSGTGINPTSV